MKIYRTASSLLAEKDGAFFPLADVSWDDLFTRDDPPARLLAGATPDPTLNRPAAQHLLPPIGSQEVWAAGVTYLRSKKARMDESKEAGGGDFYDRVYEADRPELFFKATRHRVSGPGSPVRVRKDSRWSVPEPELALAVNRAGRIIGYTIGNDLSARDIEGENLLYLPHAKTYDGCCALGPALLIAEEPLPPSTEIRMGILRGERVVFEGSTSLASMKRTPEELVAYLYRECGFPQGCYLLTGTGIVPDDSFSLQSGDVVRITIEPIGTLENVVA